MSQYLTTVRLLAVPLDSKNQHTFYFGTLSAQTSYFESCKVKEQTNCSFQRKEKIIRFDAHIDDIIKCNYVMYRNSGDNDYSSKWYYAFITKMEYKNDSMTEIHIETDVIQTWLFDYFFKPSFVEREHVKVDGIGMNTVPESVELGGYICNKHTKADYCNNTDMVIVVGATKSPDGENVRGKLYNNIYSGINYYTFANNMDGATALQEWLDSYADEGASEAITCMFLAPKKITQLKDNHETTGTNTVDTQFINGDDGLSINTAIDITDNKIDGYEPKNKKLLTYPYRYLLVSNNAGCSVPMKFEEFKQNMNGVVTNIAPRFKIEGVLCPGCSVRLIPLNYKGDLRNDEEAINLGKYPCLNWTSDVYTNWLTQNAVNIGISTASSMVSIASGIGLLATGAGALAGAGAIAGGIMGVASSLGEVYAHSMIPPQAEGNLNSGDVVTASGNNDFHFYDMSIKNEYAVIIDQYFSMYGYKVNRVKVPLTNHRENYWYTKTIDANIVGIMPVDDLRKIKECYNKGITFWKNPANIYDYTITNNPV